MSRSSFRAVNSHLRLRSPDVVRTLILGDPLLQVSAAHHPQDDDRLHRTITDPKGTPIHIDQGLFLAPVLAPLDVIEQDPFRGLDPLLDDVVADEIVLVAMVDADGEV